jgi:hypothetical protein
MRENRPSGLMRGGKQTVIGPRAFQSVASRLLYTPSFRVIFSALRITASPHSRDYRLFFHDTIKSERIPATAGRYPTN